MPCFGVCDETLKFTAHQLSRGSDLQYCSGEGSPGGKALSLLQERRTPVRFSPYPFFLFQELAVIAKIRTRSAKGGESDSC
jgi:hypothetical protein